MEYTVKIEPNGVLTIPEEYRQILGIAAGDEVTLHLEGNKLVILSSLDPVKFAQAMVRRYTAPRTQSMVDELIAERRQEAARE
jgi:AbrB family looped-hinge helix DNA binding protein